MTAPHPIVTDRRGRQVPDLPVGFYRHFKGGTYQVLGIGGDANTADRLVVVYLAPTGTPGPSLWTRNLFPDPDHGDGSGFFDLVDPRDGRVADPNDWPLPFTPDADLLDDPWQPAPGPYVRRFTYLGTARL